MSGGLAGSLARLHDAMNIQSWIVLLAVVALFIAVFRFYMKKQRRNKGCGGCSCGCNDCEHCGL